MLGLNLDGWNNLLIASFAIAAVAALVGGIATWWVVRLTGEESAALKVALKNSDERIEGLKTQGDEARSGLAEANAQIASANATAAEATLKAAEAERQNLELRDKLGNRRVTPAEHDVLVAGLSDAPGSFNLETMGDPESVLYAADLVKTLQDAHWTMDQNTWPLGVMWTGLLLAQTEDPNAVRLGNALTKAGIAWSIANQHRDKATIIVGGRPPYF